MQVHKQQCINHQEDRREVAGAEEDEDGIGAEQRRVGELRRAHRARLTELGVGCIAQRKRVNRIRLTKPGRARSRGSQSNWSIEIGQSSRGWDGAGSAGDTHWTTAF
jgi:hypothetical protein